MSIGDRATDAASTGMNGARSAVRTTSVHHVAAVGAEHRAAVADPNADAPRDELADAPRDGAPERRIGPALPPRADDVVPGVDLREQPDDLLRRILQVGIERDDDRSAALREAARTAACWPAFRASETTVTRSSSS
jgi:hypothetical protein